MAGPRVALVHAAGACLRHGLHGRRGCVRSWRRPLADHLDDGLHLGLPGCDAALGTDRGASGRHDGELGDARVVSLDRRRRGGRVRALRVRAAGRDRRAMRARRSPTLRAGTSYLVAIDAADAAGNRSAPGRLVRAHLRLPDDQQATVDSDRGQGREDHRDHCGSVLDGLDRRRRRDGLRALSVGLANERDNRHER